MVVPPAAMSISRAVERRRRSRSGCPDTVIPIAHEGPGRGRRGGRRRALSRSGRQVVSIGGHRRVERAA